MGNYDFTVDSLEIVKKMAEMEFPAYGSRCFANAPIESALKLPEEQDYVIGPLCGPRYWDCNPGEERYYSLIKRNRGPCKHIVPYVFLPSLVDSLVLTGPDLTAYCSGLTDTRFSRLPPMDAIA